MGKRVWSAVVTVGYKYQVLNSCRELGSVLCPPRVLSLYLCNHPGREVLLFSSSDKFWKLRLGQDKGLAQGRRASAWWRED